MRIKNTRISSPALFTLLCLSVPLLLPFSVQKPYCKILTILEKSNKLPSSISKTKVKESPDILHESFL